MSATTDVQISQESLTGMTIAQIRELAESRLGMTMPQKWSKPQIIEAVLFQALPTPDGDDPEGEPEIPESPASVTTGRFSSEAPNVSATPVEKQPVEQLTPAISRDDVAAKLAAHRSRLAEEQKDREEQAAAKPRYQPWQPTEAELVKRAGKIGYSIGSLLFAYNRLRKEIGVLGNVLDAMGELADDSALLRAKQAIISQYAHNKDRACFPSAALDSAMKGDELRDAVWQEIIAVGVPIRIAQLLGDQPLDVTADFLNDGDGDRDDAE